MLSEITIRGLRGIPSLALDDFSTVNIFIGTNGVGKTTVLEAIALAANPLVNGLIHVLQTWRGAFELPPLQIQQLQPAQLKQWEYAFRGLFPEMKISGDIVIDYRVKGTKQSLTLCRISGPAVPNVSSSAGSSSGLDMASQMADHLRGVSCRHEGQGRDTFESSIELGTGAGFQFKMPSAVSRDFLGAFSIAARKYLSVGETATELTKLQAIKRKGLLIKALKAVDCRVNDLVAGFENGLPVIHVDVSLREMIPIHLMGDGFCRVCLMLTGMVSQQSKLLLVDEIDSGLHPSVMEGFWLSMLGINDQFPFQLFCATHSEDMLYRTLSAFEDHPDRLRIYRLDRADKGIITAQKYTYDLYRKAEAAGFDIR